MYLQLVGTTPCYVFPATDSVSWVWDPSNRRSQISTHMITDSVSTRSIIYEVEKLVTTWMIVTFIEIIVVRVVLLTDTVKHIATYVVDIENISWNINLLL